MIGCSSITGEDLYDDDERAQMGAGGVDDAVHVIDAVGRNVGGVFTSYGQAQSGAIGDVLSTGAISIGSLIALAVAGVILYKIVDSRPAPRRRRRR